MCKYEAYRLSNVKYMHIVIDIYRSTYNVSGKPQEHTVA